MSSRSSLCTGRAKNGITGSGFICKLIVLMLLAVFDVGASKCQDIRSADQAAVPSRITAPIDANVRTALKGTIHPLANAANDRGVAPDSLLLERIHLVLRRSDSQEQALHRLIEEMHTPGSVNYHKWLTPDQFGLQFGPSEEDIAGIETWLQSNGLAVSHVNPGRQTIEFSGSAGQFRKAFHSSIHKYEVQGETRYANATDPEIPAALTPVVGGFVALNNFPVRSFVHVLGKASYQQKSHQVTPQWTNSSKPSLVLAPADFAVQYDLGPLYQAGANGSGQSIAIVNESNINIEQVNQFRTIFGLPANPPQIVIDGNDPGIDGINNWAGPNGASTEAYLDVEWAGSVAPNATVYLVIASDSFLEAGLLLAAEHAVYSNIAPVISMSFGACEKNLQSTNAFFNNLWEQAAAQGITVLVSTGDNGSAGCDSNSQELALHGLGVNGLASTPYNIAVGGTDFYYPDYQNLSAADLGIYWNLTPTQLPQASLLQVNSEQPWNDSQYGLNANSLASGTSSIVAGSGGKSSCESFSAGASGTTTCISGYPKPAWQTGAGVPADQVRDLPDVSLFAANGANLSYYPICASDGDCQLPSGSGSVQITGVGGTSASAPAFAGIMALVNQRYGRQGQAATVLYPLKTQFPAAFHDVTVGTIAVPCAYTPSSPDCISVANPVTVDEGATLEGQLGIGTTPAYNAAAGYNLATGLGTIDATQLVNQWGSVKFKATTTTLTPSHTTFPHGTSIDLSGTVTASTGIPTGDVALMSDSPLPLQQGLTSFMLTNGTFNSNSFIGLPGGTYNIWGQYGGDSVNAASTSVKTQITVTPEGSGILYMASSAYGEDAINYGTLGSEVQVFPFGTFVEMAGEIVPKSCTTFGACPMVTVPTGQLIVTDNGVVIGSTPINSIGTYEYVTYFPVGTHSVSLTYSGDASYNPYTTPLANFSVVQGATLLNLSINGSNTGQGVGGTETVLSVQVINTSILSSPSVPPTGTVTVSGAPDGVTSTVTLSPAVQPGSFAAEGIADIIFPSSIPIGAYPVTVTYSGDSNYLPSSTVTNVIVASPGAANPSTITVTSSATSSSPLASIQISGAVNGQPGGPAPIGWVGFYSSGYNLGWMNLTVPATGNTDPFSFTLNSQNLYIGTNLITVVYSGDTNYSSAVTTLNLSNPLSDFSLSPASTNIPLAVGGTMTDSLQLSSTNGFAGTISYTCSAAAGISCSLNPTSNTLLSNGNAATSVTVSAAPSTPSGNYNVVVTGRDSTGQFIHTLGLDAIVGASTGSAKFSLTNSGDLTVNSANSQSAMLVVTPSGGFAGVVNFSCSIQGAPAGLTCSAPSTTISASPAGISSLAVSATSATPFGSYQATIIATDAATGKISSSSTLNLTVAAANRATPTVGVTPYHNPNSVITNDQALPVAIVVSGGSGNPIPTGKVVLSSGSYVSAAIGLTSGSTVITIPTGALAVGVDLLTASYTPDSNSASFYNSSTGSASTDQSARAKLLPQLSAYMPSQTISVLQSLAVTIMVSGGEGNPAPTGTVVFSAGSYTSSAATLNNGGASITVPAGGLPFGNNTVVVTYTPDAASLPIYSVNSLTTWAQVEQAVPVVTVSPSATSITTSQTLTVSVSVGAGAGSPTATGTVALSGSGYYKAGVSLSGGNATFNIPAETLTPGSDKLTVTYTPDAASASVYWSRTGTSTVTVTGTLKTAPSLMLIPSSTSITTAQSLTVSASVSGGSGNPTPSGTIVLTGGGYTSAAATLNNSGIATVSIPAGSLAAGIDALTATYTPDVPGSAIFLTATGSTSVTVTDPSKITPTVTETLSTTTLTTAQALTVTIGVSGGSGNPAPSGTVIVTGCGYTSAAATLNNGNATVNIPAGSLCAGNYSLWATYMPDASGSSIYNTATGSASVTVTAPSKATPTVTETLSTTTLTTAQALTVTIGVSGGSGNPTPSGTVILTGGGYTSAAVTLSGGNATVNIPAGSLAVGVDSLTASYTPDASSSSIYNTATGSISVTVTAPPKATPTVTETLSASTLATAQALVVTIGVSGGSGNPTPSGTVILTGGGYTSAAVTLSGGNATVNIPAGSLAVGVDSLTASYTPDASSSSIYNTATGSNSVTVTTVTASSFALTTSSVSVAPGATTGNTSTITVTPAGGFTGSVALTASLSSSPAGAQYSPTLSFGSTSPVGIAGVSPGTATLTISTTAATSASLTHPPHRGVTWRSTSSVALACILLFGIPFQRRRWRTSLGMLTLLIALTGGVLGCGGGGGSSPAPTPTPASNPGTTAGTYTVTITGTSGTIVETAEVTVTVQ